ncbi:hypothetical protein MTR_5g080545 [Medicago truncatula]|uniref:Transmembrane protein n=1 Tax=Medicago truncatula TaxID=3880 RepID=A0A072UFQ8_MEDTR|nr:hypothetical protein MTR_5g080545 [Medicago truncatula]
MVLVFGIFVLLDSVDFLQIQAVLLSETCRLKLTEKYIQVVPLSETCRLKLNENRFKLSFCRKLAA